MTAAMETYDAVVVGGGPAGATAATTLARKGLSVLLLDRGGRRGIARTFHAVPWTTLAR